MSHRIVSIDPHSPACRAGIRPGDRLASVNGETVVDFIDYQALTARSRLTVQVLRDGRPLDFILRKDEYAPLGLNFETPMMSGTRLCCNRLQNPAAPPAICRRWASNIPAAAKPALPTTTPMPGSAASLPI